MGFPGATQVGLGKKLLEKYPKVENYDEVLQRQFVIANRYLGGQWFKLWGYVPFFPSMDKTSGSTLISSLFGTSSYGFMIDSMNNRPYAIFAA